LLKNILLIHTILKLKDDVRQGEIKAKALRFGLLALSSIGVLCSVL
jgi:hypothetical protein